MCPGTFGKKKHLDICLKDEKGVEESERAVKEQETTQRPGPHIYHPMPVHTTCITNGMGQRIKGYP